MEGDFYVLGQSSAQTAQMLPYTQEQAMLPLLPRGRVRSMEPPFSRDLSLRD